MPEFIYKKTLANVLRHVIENKRTEIKVTARKLGISRDSARIALNTLTKYGFIKERKYSDIGVSYFYPSNKRLMTIFVLDPHESFVFVCDSSMNIKYNMSYGMVGYMDTKMNLHHFLKRTCLYFKADYGAIPGGAPFLAIPGTINESTQKIHSEFFPDLTSCEIEMYLRDIINVKRIGLFEYKYLPDRSRHDIDYLTDLMLGAAVRFFVKKKNHTNN